MVWILLETQKPDEYRKVDLFVEIPGGTYEVICHTYRLGDDFFTWISDRIFEPRIPYSRYLMAVGAVVTHWKPSAIPPPIRRKIEAKDGK